MPWSFRPICGDHRTWPTRGTHYSYHHFWLGGLIRCWLGTSIHLIFQEDESNALVRTITEQCATSSISRVEVIRIVQRTNPGSLGFAREELSKLILLPISEAIIRIAESISGLPTLRSLDAIHVASALLVQNSIGGLITYDAAMARNARELGLVVHSPT